jgi:hypothetical protein
VDRRFDPETDIDIAPDCDDGDDGDGESPILEAANESSGHITPCGPSKSDDLKEEIIQHIEGVNEDEDAEMADENEKRKREYEI